MCIHIHDQIEQANTAERKKLVHKGQAATSPDTALPSVAKPERRATDKAKPKAEPAAATASLTSKNVRTTHQCYFYNQHLRHPDTTKPCMHGGAKRSYKHERASDEAFAAMIPPSKTYDEANGSQSGGSDASSITRRNGKGGRYRTQNIYHEMHDL